MIWLIAKRRKDSPSDGANPEGQFALSVWLMFLDCMHILTGDNYLRDVENVDKTNEILVT